MKFLFSVFLVLCITFCDAQENASISNVVPEYDRIPIYKGCERHKTNEKLMKCFDKKLSKFLEKNFNLDITDEIGLPKGTYRINSVFKISTAGKLIGIKSRSTHVALEEEAIRVLKLVPRMQPAILDGKHVSIPYSIPMNITVFKTKKQK